MNWSRCPLEADSIIINQVKMGRIHLQPALRPFPITLDTCYFSWRPALWAIGLVAFNSRQFVLFSSWFTRNCRFICGLLKSVRSFDVRILIICWWRRRPVLDSNPQSITSHGKSHQKLAVDFEAVRASKRRVDGQRSRSRWRCHTRRLEAEGPVTYTLMSIFS